MIAPKRSIKWLFGAVMVGGAFALLWAGGWQPTWELFSDREQLRAIVEGSGPLAPIVYLLLLVFQAIVLPLLAPPVAFVGDSSSGLVGASHSPGPGLYWEARRASVSPAFSVGGL